MLYQRRHVYQALRRYERSNVARYCTMLYGISSHELPSRLHPPLANTTSSYIVLVLARKPGPRGHRTSRSCTTSCRGMWSTGARSIVTVIADKRTLTEKYGIRWPQEGEILKMSEKQRILFWDTQACAYRMVEVILNSSQCYLARNWHFLCYYLMKSRFSFRI